MHAHANSPSLLNRRSLLRGSCGLAAGLVLAFASTSAWAATYQVGPTRANTQLSTLAPQLAPGDLVEVDGDAIYEAVNFENDGTEALPIIIRGMPVDGKRPILEGGDHTILLESDWTTIEGFEIRGGQQVCVMNKAHAVVLRDVSIHDCPRHGVLGADDESGSITISYAEIYNSGSEPDGESLKHPVYIATDETLHPGSVFRLEHTWIHNNAGGNSVKSRAERSEIYYNWIEGAQYYVIELIGPEVRALGPPREDHDVVGNVLINNSPYYLTRVGSDEAGASEGRHRFVNNTFILGPTATGVIRVHYEAETVEFYNNIFLRQDADWGRFMRDSEAMWVDGRNVQGSNNWFSSNGTIEELPGEFTGNLFGLDPGFTDVAAFDFRPREGSPLIDAGTTDTITASGSPPRALGIPGFVPPLFVQERAGGAFPRNAVGTLDIGAYEFGSPTAEPGEHPPGSGPGTGPGPGPGPGAPDGGGGGPGAATPDVLIGGCAIGAGSRETDGRTGAAFAGLALLGALAFGRRSRRR